jgi:hypothetical protein
MSDRSYLHGLSVIGVLIGIAILLYGEQFHIDAMVYGGGVIVILAVAVETVVIAQLPAASGH